MICRFRFLFFSMMLLLFSCNKKSSDAKTQANNDSIAKYLKLARTDSLSFEERDRWNEKAFSLIDLSKNDTVVRYFLCETALNFSKVKKREMYYKISKLHFCKATEGRDTLNLARFYRYRGGFHKNNTQLSDSAFYYYIKAEKFYKMINDETGLVNVYLNKGIIQYNIDDYLGADVSLSKAYNIAVRLNNKIKIYGTLNQLGLVASQLHEYKKSINYFKLALRVVRENNLQTKEHQEQVCLANLGLAYSKIEDYSRAIFFFNKALLNKKIKSDNPNLYSNIIDDLGYCKMQLNDNSQLPDLFYKSLKIRDSLKSRALCISYMNLSEYYLKRDSLKSILFSEKAVKIAKEAKTSYLYLVALSNAGEINKNKASEYIKEYHNTNDSVQFEQRKAHSQFFKIQLETNEIVQEKEKAIKQKWFIVSAISGVLLIVILLFVIYRQRTRQKELKLMQNQQKANEEIYQLMLDQQSNVEEARQIEKKRIALELHDGIMNRLASTRMNLFVLSKKSDKETISNCIGYIDDIKTIENEIRNVSHNLNQELFTEKYSFKLLLIELVGSHNKNSNANYELQIDENVNWDLISSEIKMHLYRIIQEACFNTNKYANASEALIHFTIDNNNLIVTISDNGIGFDAEKVNEGIGLKNMQQRIDALKGTLTITSKINKGTTLYLRIPFKLLD